MNPLPQKKDKLKKENSHLNNFSFFYITLFAILILFLSVFAFTLKQNSTKVLGIKSENTLSQNNITNQVEYWQNFLSLNPQYLEGWMELYTLTGNEDYLIMALKIDPNR